MWWSWHETQVNNPCAVLNQDESKRLANASSDDKYDFFYRATGLKMINDELTEASLASRIPSLCTHLIRAVIEWRRCRHAVCMARPCKEPHHSGQAGP